MIIQFYFGVWIVILKKKTPNIFEFQCFIDATYFDQKVLLALNHILDYDFPAVQQTTVAEDLLLGEEHWHPVALKKFPLKEVHLVAHLGQAYSAVDQKVDQLIPYWKRLRYLEAHLAPVTDLAG